MHAALIKHLFRLEEISFIFMTVRDPVKRAISEYRMRANIVGSPDSLKNWFQGISRAYLSDNFIAENHIRPQSEFWLPTCDIYRQENGFKGLTERIEERVNMKLQYRDIPFHGQSEKAAPAFADDEQAVPLIRQFYSDDYLKFGY